MARKYSGFCKVCRRHFNAPDTFNERDHGLKCPVCNVRMSLQFQSVEQVKKQLALSNNEIGSGLALIVPILK